MLWSFSDSAYMQLYDRINEYLFQQCEWLAMTPGGTYIRESTWQFPTIEGTHVLALAVSVGLILWFDLRLVGWTMRHQPISEVFNGIYYWMVGGFALMTITGLLLFWAEADRAFPNIFFRLKVMGLLFAGLNILYFHLGTQRSQSDWDKSPIPPFRVRVAGLLSISMWTIVIAAGRLMAYTF